MKNQENNIELREGDRVRILVGPFKGVEGTYNGFGRNDGSDCITSLFHHILHVSHLAFYSLNQTFFNKILDVTSCRVE